MPNWPTLDLVLIWPAEPDMRSVSPRLPKPMPAANIAQRPHESIPGQPSLGARRPMAEVGRVRGVLKHVLDHRDTHDLGMRSWFVRPQRPLRAWPPGDEHRPVDLRGCGTRVLHFSQGARYGRGRHGRRATQPDWPIPTGPRPRRQQLTPPRRSGAVQGTAPAASPRRRR